MSLSFLNLVTRFRGMVSLATSSSWKEATVYVGYVLVSLFDYFFLKYSQSTGM